MPIDAEVARVERDEAPCEEAGAGGERQRQRHLQHDAGVANHAAPIESAAAAVLLEDVIGRDAADGERRRDAEHERRRQRDERREREHPPVGLEVQIDAQRDRRQLPHQLTAPRGEPDTHRRASRADTEALGQELPRDAPP